MFCLQPSNLPFHLPKICFLRNFTSRIILLENTIKFAQIRSKHTKPLYSEKDLILKVLEVYPSKREAKSYLSRFDVKEANLTTSQSRYPIALITLKAPFFKKDLKKVSETLACIKRIGIAPVLLLENLSWMNTICASDCLSIENFREHRQIMLQDGLALCALLELENVKTRLIPSGVFLNKKNNSHQPSEIDPDPILSCLRTGSVPALLPISCTPSINYIISSSYDSIAALSKWFSRYNLTPSNIEGKVVEVMRFIVVNSRGGIPDATKRTIPFVNLQDDLEELVIQSGSWKGYLAPAWKLDLDLAYCSLAYLPATTSAIVVSASSIGAVINNLITDKPPVSPSLPHGKEIKCDVTILRYGLNVVSYYNLDAVDLDKIWTLMESSFRKKVDKANYIVRLQSSLSYIIIAGDYQGLAIVTREPGGVCYLDKFAVDPENQGIGVADVLWQRLQQLCPDLLWRSRFDNGVNKWYFDRSDGNIALKSSPWRMFWYGSSGIKKIGEYAQVTANIPATFISN